nr:hypothetical protein [Tanacetum cinerariifolium]
MEAKTKRLSKAKHLSLDRISDLPPAITETILCLVPIKDAIICSTKMRSVDFSVLYTNFCYCTMVRYSSSLSTWEVQIKPAPPLISGFRSLTSLSLIRTRFYKSTLLHFLSSCPLLKRTTLIFVYDHVDESDDSTYTDLLKSIPVIEHLSVNPEICESFSHDMVQPELPSALVYLKYFCLDGSAFLSSYQLDLIFLQVKSSPGLEKINIEMSEDPEEDEDTLDSLSLVTLDDVYSDISLKNLKELKIQNFINFMNELNFVKFILTKSLMLKKVWIILNDAVTKAEGQMICNILLDSPRASPIVDIIVEHRQKEED